MKHNKQNKLAGVTLAIVSSNANNGLNAVPTTCNGNNATGNANRNHGSQLLLLLVKESVTPAKM